MTARIDSHQHFWRISRGDYGWLRAGDPAVAKLMRDFLPANLVGTLKALGITQTVLVQAAASEAETDFLLELADANEFIAGVVGWVDLSRPESVATLERWARNAKFKGVRPMLQDLPANDWIAREPHAEVVQALVRLGLRFDALVKPWHLEPLLRFVKRHPQLPVVIDHAAKPQLVQGWQAHWAGSWRRHLASLAAQPQVSCKLSGLLGEAPPAASRSVAEGVDALRPVWDALLQWFGPERLMWGSDWPVLTLVADYARWVAVCDSLIGELSPPDQARVWQGNAQRFYGLPVH
ncbi:amidohydrolase family protein [Piscinibacter sp.]|jgi:L-fuconolactonase|uniref:amidohydrolase family protein n=1 Tax=Piscinibacter sp. TaxID=1903157 RepID=UPI001B430A05|nr:amidohydrolase family protein [Piscinibacter sp.]MBK7533736.1 amidohydrolase family protein [Piscinibacter sp.]MBP6541743.1 amidohydrolase family protein [Piscinibacter sp.]HPG77091.1 amidohydrolase family protein [Piscinibacter sp.]